MTLSELVVLIPYSSGLRFRHIICYSSCERIDGLNPLFIRSSLPTGSGSCPMKCHPRLNPLFIRSSLPTNVQVNNYLRRQES